MSAFILVEKDGEQISIHPDAQADHARLGWVVAADAQQLPAAPIEERAAEKPVEKPAKKSGK